MRALGIDLGTKRIGLAVSDPDGRIASPLSVIPRDGKAHQRIAETVTEWEVERVVVGLPLRMDGGTGPAAEAALAEADRLAAALSVPVETYDERLTTVTAQRVLREHDVPGSRRRAVVDKIAAAVMLQAWLDGRREQELP